MRLGSRFLPIGIGIRVHERKVQRIIFGIRIYYSSMLFKRLTADQLDLIWTFICLCLFVKDEMMLNIGLSALAYAASSASHR